MRLHLVLAGLLIVTSVSAQEKKEQKEGMKGTHQLSLMISHSHIFEGVNDEGEKKWLVMPSWGLDYNYWLANKWSVGIHADIIVEDFKVEKEGESSEILQRSTPFCAVGAAQFKPGKHSVFILALGGEFAKEGNYFVTRAGYEYGWELPHNWELSAGLTYDFKWNAYDTWTLGLSVSHLFHKKEKR